MRLRATLAVLRSGGLRRRMAAVNDGRRATRLAQTAAAIDLGVLDALRPGPLTLADLADRVDASDVEILGAFVAVLGTNGLIEQADGRVSLTRRGEGIADDKVARAAYSTFSDYHTGLFRELAVQLRGGPGRDDVTRRAEAIAHLSEVMAPYVEAELRTVVEGRPSNHVLDFGCGTGGYLATMLEAATAASGVGIELDAETAVLARAHLAAGGLADRATVLTGDARTLLMDAGPFDIALLANVIYYVPLVDRPALLRSLADVLAPGGALVIVTTALIDEPFSRHFDLLLRAQAGALELPDMAVLAAQLEEAGLRPAAPKRLTPGEPLMMLVATR